MKKFFIYLFILLFIGCSSVGKLPENKIKQDTIIKTFDSTKIINDTVKKIDTSKNKLSKHRHDDNLDFMGKLPNMGENPHPDPHPNPDPNRVVNPDNDSYKKMVLPKKDKGPVVEVKEGKLIYSIPDTMKLGNTYTITIRIKKNTNNVKIIDSLYKQKIVDIKVTNSMEVVVIDPSPSESKNFNILKQNSDKQIIDDDDYTEWVYSVQPLKSGNLKLNIIVSIIKYDNLKQVVYFNTTYVKSNTGVVVKTFWEKNWQWLLSTIIIPFIIFIYKNRKKNNETI